jgi:hypothetical protein
MPAAILQEWEWNRLLLASGRKSLKPRLPGAASQPAKSFQHTIQEKAAEGISGSGGINRLYLAASNTCKMTVLNTLRTA